MEDLIICKLLTVDDIHEISNLGQQSNPKLTLDEIQEFQKEMFDFPTYYCFGMFLGKKLIGVSSGWLTVRLYSGKQLELDNVIVDYKFQSKGYGKQLFEVIEVWAKEKGCKTIELNTYVQNVRSHKFYYSLGYSILGFHFHKKLE